MFLAQKLHKAYDVKQTFRKELEWFSSTTLIPHSVHILLPVVLINAFTSFIHDNSYYRWQTNVIWYGPRGISSCMEKTIFVWRAHALGSWKIKWNSKWRFLCLTFVGNICRFCQKHISEHRILPKKILF